MVITQEPQMGLGTLPFTSPYYSSFTSKSKLVHNNTNNYNRTKKFIVSAKQEKKEEDKNKQSFFTSVTDALDFAQPRSEQDAQLIADAREATKSGEKMSKEQVQYKILEFLHLLIFMILLK